MLHEFITLNRDEIIRRCRAKVAVRSVPPPTEAEINHGVPLFLDQLVAALRAGQSSSPEIGTTAVLHARDMQLQGFTVSQVVHDYGDVCQSITELAIESGAPIDADDFRLLNYCLDDAIARAVTEYGRERDQNTLEGEVDRGTVRLGFLAHELRNLINTALLAFHVLRSGNVGISGSTGTALHRNLVSAADLISRSLAEVRLAQGAQSREHLALAAFLRPLADDARLAADAEGITVVFEAPDDVAIDADPQVMAAVVMNLLQNAIKFTRPHTTVTLRATASGDRVLIEVEDGCGGLPHGDAADLFRPFEQRGTNKSGLGLGLAFSRWGTEANSGRIYARDIPGTGCVFTVNLPRSGVSALAPA
ncbi:MAG TPA: HAMP domain-containing sensor histidine kinase [Vicinamibacterales bacterium]|nr:HAMP domain-containing sensor histidine kinase [Vicinamibacterales bacterium]